MRFCLHERAEACKRLVPHGGNLIQITANVSEAFGPKFPESTRKSSIKLNADKRIYVVADWTKPESFLHYTFDRDRAYRSMYGAREQWMRMRPA